MRGQKYFYADVLRGQIEQLVVEFKHVQNLRNGYYDIRSISVVGINERLSGLECCENDYYISRKLVEMIRTYPKSETSV